jgi:hypothetical protein
VVASGKLDVERGLGRPSVGRLWLGREIGTTRVRSAQPGGLFPLSWSEERPGGLSGS